MPPQKGPRPASPEAEPFRVPAHRAGAPVRAPAVGAGLSISCSGTEPSSEPQTTREREEADETKNEVAPSKTDWAVDCRVGADIRPHRLRRRIVEWIRRRLGHVDNGKRGARRLPAHRRAALLCRGQGS